MQDVIARNSTFKASELTPTAPVWSGAERKRLNRLAKNLLPRPKDGREPLERNPARKA